MRSRTITVGVLYFKSLVRDKLTVFWMLVFPALLVASLGHIFTGKPGIAGVAYLAADDDAIRGVLSEMLAGLNFEVILLNGTNGYNASYMESLIRDGVERFLVERVVAVTASCSRSGAGENVVSVAIYGTSPEVVAFLEELLAVGLRAMLASESLPKVVVSGYHIRAATGKEAFYATMAMLIPLSSVMSVAGLVGTVFELRLNKLIHLSPGPWRLTLAAILLPSLMLTLLSLLVVTAVDYALFGTDVAKVLGSVTYWLAFLLTFLFSLALDFLVFGLSTSVAPVYSTAFFQQSAVAAFLIIAFVSGYFFPYETLPDSLKLVARALPPFYALTAVKKSALYEASLGAVSGLLSKALLVDVLVLAAGLKVFRWVRKL